MDGKLARSIEWLGNKLMLIGGLAIAGIFLTVLINGHWPDSFSPLRNFMRGAGDLVGDAVWFLWVAIFIGPGFLVQQIGERLGKKR